ncbi:hypothetical protein DV26_27135 [Amycolatopsis mediterranei]|uniref:Uncharacterized protein n=1 Tax=Amycolatopsis mediterranei (strain S699) TaxID=713604 RepID=A0A9R0P5S1_AMYMS|nr:hypothetical protein RAM_41540 [Amycolatopsis mediterranei S699]KDO07963.1 hypothetical protein DV26_27135 [Amycolatopsis mediterranei]KDU93141.1 hypothetical protein DV36_03625 [Amycolatopsis mediterranei]
MCAIATRQAARPAALFSCAPQSVGFAALTCAATWCGLPRERTWPQKSGSMSIMSCEVPIFWRKKR